VRTITAVPLPVQRTSTEPGFGEGFFVVGDTNSRREALRAAREEAEAVKRELGKSYDVISLPPDVDAQRLTQELISGEYRIVHFAAHGEFHPGDPSHSGVVIGKDNIPPLEIQGFGWPLRIRERLP
jgi:CHAT domain-containing protein